MSVRIIAALLVSCLIVWSNIAMAFDDEENLTPAQKAKQVEREQKLGGEIDICGDVVADLGIDDSTRFVLLNEDGEYYPYLYQAAKDFEDNCGQLGAHICAKAKKQLEIPAALNKKGIKSWQMTIIHQCHSMAAPG